MKMELIEWMNSLAEKGAEVTVFKHPYSKWRIKLEMTHEGMTLECAGEAETFQEALRQCLDRFEKVNSGKVRFDGPLLEHTPAVPDDEIPL